MHLLLTNEQAYLHTLYIRNLVNNHEQNEKRIIKEMCKKHHNFKVLISFLALEL